MIPHLSHIKQDRDYVGELIIAYDALSKKLNKKSFTFGIDKRKFKIEEVV